MGAKGDQDMAILGDADWSQDSPMDEGARVLRSTWFVQQLHLQILPNDWENGEGFDVRSSFRIGDPNFFF